ncbi:MAG: hypothetical protein JWP89_6682 [Schlesneria sp.]|nr:hypothetical protein [Schlesneria sp.]
MDHCRDCESTDGEVLSRRRFVQAAGSIAAAVAVLPAVARAEEPAKAPSETLVKKLHDSLTPKQKEEVCFDWDYKDDRGLLRMHVSNNWNITDQRIAGGFFNKDQQDIIEALFWGLYNPDWHDRIKKQLQDDAGGYGKEQSIAIFGTPGTDKFEFVMTGRHLTIRCDGNSVDHAAFGGPIFYGHAASGFNEEVRHPGNVYWHQAQSANALFKMLDGKQRVQALLDRAPAEAKVHFGGPDGKPSGILVGDLSSDQKEHMQKVLATLIEPYRTADQDEVRKCLAAQGGLDKCRLAFHKTDAAGNVDLGDDGEWDNWRLEGPAFVWHYRGMPHVHVWVNIADDPSVQITARG